MGYNGLVGGRGNIGVENDREDQPEDPSDDLGGNKWQHCGRCDTREAVGDIRPTVTAGFAKDVELVNQ